MFKILKGQLRDVCQQFYKLKSWCPPFKPLNNYHNVNMCSKCHLLVPVWLLFLKDCRGGGCHIPHTHTVDSLLMCANKQHSPPSYPLMEITCKFSLIILIT